MMDKELCKKAVKNNGGDLRHVLFKIPAEMYNWIVKQGYNKSGIFNEAVKELGYSVGEGMPQDTNKPTENDLSLVDVK